MQNPFKEKVIGNNLQFINFAPTYSETVVTLKFNTQNMTNPTIVSKWNMGEILEFLA